MRCSMLSWVWPGEGSPPFRNANAPRSERPGLAEELGGVRLEAIIFIGLVLRLCTSFPTHDAKSRSLAAGD